MKLELRALTNSARPRDSSVGDAVGEILLLRIAAHVGEGQHRDRRLIRQRQCRTLRRAEPNPEHLNLGCDVLKFRCAEIRHLQRDLAGGILADAPGNADAARLGKRFQARRDDHAITEQIVALRHHLALVHADAQPQAVRLGAQPLLNGDRAAQCLNGAGEGGEEAVACGLEQPASVLSRERLYQIGAQ